MKLVDKSKYVLDENGNVTLCMGNLAKLNWLEYLVFFFRLDFKMGLLEPVIEIGKNLFFLLSFIFVLVFWFISLPILANNNLNRMRRNFNITKNQKFKNDPFDEDNQS